MSRPFSKTSPSQLAKGYRVNLLPITNFLLITIFIMNGGTLYRIPSFTVPFKLHYFNCRIRTRTAFKSCRSSVHSLRTLFSFLFLHPCGLSCYNFMSILNLGKHGIIMDGYPGQNLFIPPLIIIIISTLTTEDHFL